jgi:hypothetical protein
MLVLANSPDIETTTRACMTVSSHGTYRVVATISCVIGASAGAPEGFTTWLLFALVACSALIVRAHNAPSPARARMQSAVEARP